MNQRQISENVTLQKEICDWENVITSNLKNLAQALDIASEGRFMSQDHASIIWKSYLKVSGMDIPKDLKTRVTAMIESEKTV